MKYNPFIAWSGAVHQRERIFWPPGKWGYIHIWQTNYVLSETICYSNFV